MARQRKAVAVVLVAAGLMAAACSEPPTSGSGESADVAAGGEAALPECPLDSLDNASGPVDVTLWYGGIGGVTEETMKHMVEAFNASQDEVHVTASNQGSSYAEVYRKFESAASANTDQLPDVVLLENTQLQVLADGGLILPAQSCMEAAGYDITDIEPAVRSAFSVNDVLYPGYANVTSQVLYYNKAHWVKAGLDPTAPPKTLEEIYEQAKKLKAAGVSDKPWAFKISATVFENWLSGAGIDVVNNSNGHDGQATEATFDTPEARDALALLKRMNDEGLVNVFASTEGGIDQYLALATQQSSMLIETSGAAVNIAEALGGNLTAADVGAEFDSSLVDRTQLVPGTGLFPGLESAGQVHPGGSGFFIVNTAPPEEQAGAWKFLEFMLQPENAKEWHLRGSYLPIVKSVADEPDVQSFWTDQVAGVLIKPAVDQLADADPDEPGPLIGPYTDFTDNVENAIEGVLLSGDDVESALSTAQDEVTQSLERYAGN
ncbi:MAG TPA: ABC transporter substrate-binding protein [Acidimicrobiales bacterium]|nr:ABC transporter substrate-binding protein [Acidimicrobiales bacterium]